MPTNTYQNKAKTPPQATLWWLSPVGLSFGFLLPVFLSIIFIGIGDSAALQIRGFKYLNATYIALGIALVIAMAMGAWVGEKIEYKNHGEIIDRNWPPVLWTLGLIAFFAYLFWFKDIFFSPSTLFKMLTGGLKLGRQEIGATPGVTSLVNFIPVYFALTTHIWTTAPKALGRPLKTLTIMLFFLTVFRVYVWAERLALIELMAAVALPLVIHFYRTNSNIYIKKVLTLGPIIALPLLVLYFGIAEYFRSWQSATYNGRFDFWTFALGRLGTYYYTSLNNGAGLLELFQWPSYKFENVLLFAIKAPGIIGPIFSYYTDQHQSTMERFLTQYGDPEFNNPSGLYSVVYDIGIGGGFYYFTLLGFLAGALYKSFLRGGARGVVFYPLFFVMMLEVYRYPYFGQPRAFTSLLGAFFAIWILGTKTTKLSPSYFASLTALTIRRK